MNKPLERTIRKFNPGTFQTDEEVIRQFVVRKREFGIAMEVLRENVGAPSCQHVLLVGPRGRGKTMLLARVVAEIRTDDVRSRRLLPVRFMEESHVYSMLATSGLRHSSISPGRSPTAIPILPGTCKPRTPT